MNTITEFALWSAVIPSAILAALTLRGELDQRRDGFTLSRRQYATDLGFVVSGACLILQILLSDTSIRSSGISRALVGVALSVTALFCYRNRRYWSGCRYLSHDVVCDEANHIDSR